MNLLAERYEMGEPRDLNSHELEDWQTRKLRPVQIELSSSGFKGCEYPHYDPQLTMYTQTECWWS